MSNELGKLFSDIAGAIREKTGETGTMKPAQFPAKIAGIQSGGGSSEDVRYVTFMSHDGAVEYGKKAVAVGDNCADPIARGVFGTPTRESTAQYNYTFAGWSTEPNGGLNNNALKAVNEDRTVYANYAAAVRYYTITYYDGDVVFKSESMPYGTIPAFTTEKEGYNFEGWEPELTAVVSDADYFALFTEGVTFAGASWSDIARISEAGDAPNVFALGDTKEFMYYGDKITVQIVGFNHDDLADGTGKAGISVLCKTLPNKTCPWVTKYDANTAPHLYRDSELRTKLTGEMYNNLPDELKAVIKPVKKKSDASTNTNNLTDTIETTDYLWAPSVTELGRNSENQMTSKIATLGSKYDLFPWHYNYGYDIAFNIGTTGAIGEYWTRQYNRFGTNVQYIYLYNNEDGASYSAQGTAQQVARYVRFGFCI